MSISSGDFTNLFDSKTAMRVFIKDDFARVEIVKYHNNDEYSDNRTMIIRFDKGVMWLLENEKECYTEMVFKDSLDHGDAGNNVDTITPVIKVDSTGNKKKILDFDCHEFVVSMELEDDQGIKSYAQTMWMARDFPGYQEITTFNTRMAEIDVQADEPVAFNNDNAGIEFKKKVREIRGFPMEVTLDVTLSHDGVMIPYTVHSEVTNIVEAPINLNVFEIPANFRSEKQGIEQE